MKILLQTLSLLLALPTLVHGAEKLLMSNYNIRQDIKRIKRIKNDNTPVIGYENTTNMGYVCHLQGTRKYGGSYPAQDSTGESCRTPFKPGVAKLLFNIWHEKWEAAQTVTE